MYNFDRIVYRYYQDEDISIEAFKAGEYDIVRMVSNDGVVYEKDFGATTLEEFKKIERFNPDETWAPVEQ